jgi:death-on-curing protein
LDTTPIPGIDEKAAVFLESIVGSHSLLDVNQRLGWLASVLFYGLNAETLEALDDDTYDLATSIVSGVTTYSDAARHLAVWQFDQEPV